ncbi:MAG: hypothetical protein N2201_02085 [candidate division WOR-3 bacterium]|nr:hypothetical protein [candidate division WOR-3 bacterium]
MRDLHLYVRSLVVLLAIIVSLSSFCKRKPEENYLEPVNVSNNSGRSENPSIAVDSRGTVHLVWTDNTYGIQQGNQWNQEILYAYKPAGGIWSTPVNISNNARASRFPCIKVDGNDNLHLVWQDASPDGYWRIFYTFKMINSTPWETPETICTYLGDVIPVIDIDTIGRIFMVWRVGGYNDYIFFSMKDVNALWTSPIPITPQGYHANHTITADIKGNVHVAWDEWDGGYATKVFYIMRDTAGNWTQPLAIIPHRWMSSSPVLVSDKEGGIHIAWVDTALIYMCKPLNESWSAPEFPASQATPWGIAINNTGTIYISYGSTRLIKKPKNCNWCNPILVYRGGIKAAVVIDNTNVKHMSWYGTPPNGTDFDIYYVEIKNY